MKKSLFGVCLAVLAVSSWGCVEPEGEACTVNACVGNIANYCINGSVVPKDCGAAGCDALTGTCNTGTAQCTANTCSGNVANLCLNGTIVSQDCGTAGCNASTGTCNSGQAQKCTVNTCNGNVANLCLNGNIVTQDCGAAGCNAATGSCNPSAGCDFDVAMCASQGMDFDAGACKCVPKQGDTPVAGASCDKDTYEGGCSSDGSKRYYCGNDGTLVEKDCNSGSTCVVKGNNSSSCEAGEVSDCAPGGTAYCNKVCKADGSEGYYYSKGEVHTVSCPNNDCTTASGRVECAGGTVTPQPGEPVAGASCDKNTYEGGCSSDGSKRYYCGNDGKLVEKDCNTGSTCVVKGGNSSTCEAGEVSDCAPGGTAYCNKVCKADGSEGYYYSQGKVNTVSCPNNDCTTASGRVECAGGTVTPQPGEPVAGASCDKDAYEGGCSSDGSKRYYCGNDGKLVEKTCSTGTACVVKGGNSSTCETVGETEDCAPGGTVYCNKVCKADGSEGYYYSQGKVNTVSCPNNDCTVDNGKVVCSGGSTPDPGADPVAGASCDKNSYEGGCSSDGSKRYYCGNDGKLVEKTCSTGTACVVKGGNSSTCEKSSTPEPGDDPVAGASCDKNSYEGGCSSDGSKRYYCGNDGKLVEKTCSTGTACVVKGGNSSMCETVGEVADCAPGGTVYCNKVCKADGSEGYYYSQGKVNTVSCPNKDCTVDNGKVVCAGGSNPDPGDEPVAGAPCNQNTYEGGCSSDGSRRYYCGNNGQLVEKACNAGTSCVVNGNNSSTCKTNGVNPEPGDEPVAGASCDPKSYDGGCSGDGSKRYYCGSDNKLVEKSCNSGYTCVVKGSNSSYCEKANTCSGTKVTTGGTPGKSCCDASTYQVSCTNGNANALICSAGVVKEWTCADNVCSVSNNKVTCPRENQGTCDPNTFEPYCVSDSLGYRCSGSYKTIIEYTCASGTKCDIDYTKNNYPNGWIQCI